jgi:hypothetical protein
MMHHIIETAHLFPAETMGIKQMWVWSLIGTFGHQISHEGQTSCLPSQEGPGCGTS